MKIARRALAGLCLTVVVGTTPAAAVRQEPPKPTQQSERGQERGGFFWWRDAGVQRELDLSPRQVAKIEKIWTTNAPPIRDLRKQQEALEAETNRLIRENTADEKVLARQLDRMEAVRSQASKARWLMIYRMHQALTPEQYRKLTEINERRRKDRGRR